MSSRAGGIVYRDLLPVPDSAQPVTDPYRIESSQSIRQAPTASHALAHQAAHPDSDMGGVALMNHNKEVVDLGWNEPKELIAAPLVGGMDNEELWLLVRRFNKVCRAVSSVYMLVYHCLSSLCYFASLTIACTSPAVFHPCCLDGLTLCKIPTKVAHEHLFVSSHVRLYTFH